MKRNRRVRMNQRGEIIMNWAAFLMVAPHDVIDMCRRSSAAKLAGTEFQPQNTSFRSYYSLSRGKMVKAVPVVP